MVVPGLLATSLVYDMIKKQTDETGLCSQECKWSRLQFFFVVIALFAMASDFNQSTKKTSTNMRGKTPEGGDSRVVHKFPGLTVTSLAVVGGLSAANFHNHKQAPDIILCILAFVSMGGAYHVSNSGNGTIHQLEGGPLGVLLSMLNWFETLDGLPTAVYGVLILWNILQLADIQFCKVHDDDTSTAWVPGGNTKETSWTNRGIRIAMLMILLLMLGMWHKTKSEFTGDASAKSLHGKAARGDVKNSVLVALLLGMSAYMNVDLGYATYIIDIVGILCLAMAHQSFSKLHHAIGGLKLEHTRGVVAT